MQVFKPDGEVEFSGGEVAGGYEVEDGVLEVGGEFGEGVAGAGAGDAIEFVEAELVVEGEGWRRGVAGGFAGSGGQGRVEVCCNLLCSGPEEESGNGLKGGELRWIEVSGDIDGTGVDELLETGTLWGFGSAV